MKPVWVCFPTINAERAVCAVSRWREAGYKVALWLEPGMASVTADFEVSGLYPGYWAACNRLALAAATEASAIVLAADDLDPDPAHPPDQIAAECVAKFPDEYYVMQPTGDDKDGMDGVWRICGSPWLGLGWVRDAHEGRGPCPYTYKAFYGDERLFNIAKAQGVLWQRADLSHHHHHWCRRGGPQRTDYQNANNDKHWENDKALFQEEMAQGFPGSQRKPPA